MTDPTEITATTSLRQRLLASLRPAPDDSGLVESAPAMTLRDVLRRFWPRLRGLHRFLLLALLLLTLAPRRDRAEHPGAAAAARPGAPPPRALLRGRRAPDASGGPGDPDRTHPGCRAGAAAPARAGLRRAGPPAQLRSRLPARARLAAPRPEARERRRAGQPSGPDRPQPRGSSRRRPRGRGHAGVPGAEQHTGLGLSAATDVWGLAQVSSLTGDVAAAGWPASRLPREAWWRRRPSLRPEHVDLLRSCLEPESRRRPSMRQVRAALAALARP
jgi:hypothetical protein